MINKNNTFFDEPHDPKVEARALARETICRVFLWICDAPTIEDRGLRASVVLYCVRPDLLNGVTLEDLGHAAGRTRQWVHKLTKSFYLATGIQP